MKGIKFSIIVLMILSGVSIAACTSDGYSALNDDLQVIHDKTFKIEPGKSIKLSGSVGDILVTSWDRSEVQVKVLGNKKAMEKVDFKFNPSDDLIEVTAKREGFQFWGSGFKLRFEIKVPRKFNAFMSTSGGDIRFAGIEGNSILKTSGGDVSVKETRGKLEISTSGGDISLEKIAGSTDVSTSGGDINGRGFTGKFSASTSGGDIELDGENSEISAETSGGDIALRYSGENKGIELATSGGDIKIMLPSSFNASAYLNTSGGDVDVNISTGNVKKLSSSKFEGDLNKGGNKLVAKTSGGTITVNSK